MQCSDTHCSPFDAPHIVEHHPRVGPKRSSVNKPRIVVDAKIFLRSISHLNRRTKSVAGRSWSVTRLILAPKHASTSSFTRSVIETALHVTERRHQRTA